ncbi:MAG: hypothetical protein PWP65_212 [Clostridia bacterium]|nr:hypothetical protein [Clostridia bacterium]
MAEVRAFQGLRYNQEMVKDLALVTTPPYDVIDPAAQEEYYRRSPYNIIRLELGKILPTDTERDNRYTRAATYLKEWLRAGILQKDPTPHFYIYQQSFPGENGELLTRTGLVGRVRLVPYTSGEILPHEETLPKAKADRLALLQACRTNFSPIFSLYVDRERKVDNILQEFISQNPPWAEFTDPEQTTHRLWALGNPDLIDSIEKSFAQQTIYIADGHHRYETALEYSLGRQGSGNEGYNYVMMVLVNLYDPGLVILPTHRLVRNLASFSLDNFLKKVRVNFLVEETSLSLEDFLAGLKTQGLHTLGFYAGGQKFFYLKLKPELDLDRLYAPDKSPGWRRLDVAILHGLILEPLLGIGQAQREGESNLTYTRDAAQAYQEVKKGNQQMAFFLLPTPVEQVLAVAASGDKMPQKSTYFYPKLITGLVLHPLDDLEAI